MRPLRLLDAGYLRDLLVASDPTLERLRTGLRAVLGAALAAWALSALGARAGVPASAWLLGVNLAMASAVQVAEGPIPAQRRKALLLPVVAIAAAALAAVAAVAPPAAGAALALLVVFVAVWARRFPAAGVGAGMAAFLTFFVARYFGLTPALLPAAAAALAVGGAIAWAIRFWIVREWPERAGPRVLHALRLTVALVLRRLEDDAARGRPTPRRSRRLGAEIDRLHGAALAVDDLLVRLPVAALPSGLPVSELRDRVFEVQLAAERVVQAVDQVVASGALPARARQAAAAAIRAARAASRRAPGAPRARVGPALARAAAIAAEEGAPEAAADVARLRTSLGDLSRAARWLRAAVPERRWPIPAAPPPAPAVPGPLGLAQPTRQAIQATAAAAVAMAAGAQLSATRWFWAVIAAFVVFSRATTVADTVQRAWLRVLGTVLGAAAGALLGTAVEGHPRLELVAVFGCVFLAYWLFRVSYAWLLFWFTALIAVLYRLLGRYTPELMVLRVEETLVGAAAGALIAALVLPVRARTRVRAGTAEVLAAAGDWIDAAVVARADAGAAAPLGTARSMEDRLRALREIARPLTGGAVWSPRAAHLLHAATAVVLHARHLAPGEALSQLDAAGRAAVAEAGQRLVACARRTAALLGGAGEDDAPPAPPQPAAEAIARARATLRGEAARPHGPGSPPVWLHWLERLDEALGDVAALAEDPAGASGAGAGRSLERGRPATT